MQVNKMLNCMFSNSSFLNRRFLYRQLKPNEKVSINCSKNYKAVCKTIELNNKQYAKKIAREVDCDKIICNEMKTDAYIGSCTKYMTGELYFTRKFLENGKVHKVVYESKSPEVFDECHKPVEYEFIEANLSDDNTITEHIKTQDLRINKISETTKKKYYNYANQLVQTELYDKDNNLIQRDIGLQDEFAAHISLNDFKNPANCCVEIDL